MNAASAIYDQLVQQRPRSFIVDGEIVALDEDGRPAFNRLQRAKTRRVDVFFFIFDLLNIDGENIMDEPLVHRQRTLWKEFRETEFVRMPRPLNADLDHILEKVERFGFEGIVAKRRSSVYLPGEVPGTWLKKKLKHSDEFIIGGYEPGKNNFEDIAVGRFDGEEFKYVGVVDDGFVPNTRRQVFDAIKDLQTEACPFTNVPEKKGMHRLDRERMAKMRWVKPKVVARATGTKSSGIFA